MQTKITQPWVMADKKNHPDNVGEFNMKKIQMIQQNSFSGISEDLLSHKKLGVYLTEQYCISCAYFQQHKGNFGSCSVIPNQKTYDGTIKDNACNGYRIHPELIQKRWNIEHPSKIPQVSIFKLMREGHNEIALKRFRFRRLKTKGEYDWKNDKSEKKFGVFGLPYTQTTKQSKRIKSGYFMHKINHQVMEYALRLKRKEYTNEDIIKQIQKMFGIMITNPTIDNWNRRFGLVITESKIKTININKWNEFLYSLDHNIITGDRLKIINMKNCIFCESSNIVKKGIRMNQNHITRRYHCIKCGKYFTDRKKQFIKMKYPEKIIKRGLELFQLNLSTRQIAKTLEIEFKMKFNNVSIALWIKKYIPNPKYQINGAHRPEVNQAISKGLILYFKQKGVTKLINGENE